MAVKSDARRYGTPAVLLHWATAAAVLFLLPVGFLAARTSDPPTATALLRFHAPVGMLVLGATVGRLAWRWFDCRPDPVPGPRWQALAARTTHVLLYGVLVATASSGVGLLVASGAGPLVYGRGGNSLPRFADFAPLVPHVLGAVALLVLSSLHVGAALYHHLHRHDGLLSRMALRAGRR